MFALFFSLYYAMFTGTWSDISMTSLQQTTGTGLNKIGEFLTSIFNNVNTPMSDFGVIVQNGTWLYLVAFVLALITSIGIVVMAVKGIKRVFGVFFMGIR